MTGSIRKFERDMLGGESMRIIKKTDHEWSKKHWHNYFEIIYYSGYSGYCILNSERQEITERCLSLLSPKDFHEMFVDGDSRSYSYIISFDERMIDPTILSAIANGPFMISDVSPRLAAAISELYETFESRSLYKEQYVSHLFNCILIQILNGARAVCSVSRDISPIVQESISLMLSDPAGDYTLDFFAERFSITSAYFSRLFHKSAGISFKQYLTALRLEHSKQLLEGNSMPIIDISYECGFNTPSQFFRAFKSTFGISPSEYRKMRRKI